MQMKNNVFCADLHTHILPCMDDGARSVEESVKLILAEKKQGITDIALTPHFSPQSESIEDFITRRDESFKMLSDKLKQNDLFSDINLHLGAEVRYDPNLIYKDVFKLCIGNTSYMLLELENSHPFNLEQTVGWLLSKGVTPIFAHVERYGYLIRNKKLMEEFLYEGVLFQCNATSLLSRHHSRKVKQLIKKGYVQLIASDTHGTEERPPLLEKGLQSVAKFADMFKSNSIKVIKNEIV